MKFIFSVFFSLFSLLEISEANAAGLPQTRLIYKEQAGPAQVVIVNPDSNEVLIQVYVDSKDVLSSSVRVYPSVFTLAANSRRIVNIYGLGTLLAKDVESIRHLNVATIPQEGDKSSSVNVLIHAQYKMMLRPNNMKDLKLENAVDALKVSCDEGDCFLVNNSPFNIVFAELEVNGKGIEVEYIAPNKRIFISKGAPSSISGRYVNDYGDYISLPNISF